MRFRRIVKTLVVFLFTVSLSEGAFAQKFEIYPYAGGYWPAKIDEFKLKNQTITGLKGGYFFSDKWQFEGNFGYLPHFKFDNVDVADFVNLNNITVITVTNTITNTVTGVSVARDEVPHPAPVVTPIVTPVVSQAVAVHQLDPNRVQIIETDPTQRGYLWEGNATYNFFNSGLGTSFVPYLTVGVGGTTVTRPDGDVFSTDVIIDQPGLSAEALNQINQHVAQRIAETRTFLPSQINTGSYLTFNYGGGFKAYRLWGPVGLRGDFIGRNLPNFDGRSLNSFALTGGISIAWGER